MRHYLDKLFFLFKNMFRITGISILLGSLCVKLLLILPFFSHWELDFGFCPIRTAHAISEQAGTSGGRFFKLKFGARGIGMGGAYIAEPNDLFAVQWNPANTVFMSEREIVAQHNDMLLDMEARYLGGGPMDWKNLRVNGFLGYFDKGKFEGTSETAGGAFDDWTGSFGAHDLKTGVGVSGLIYSRLGVGGTIKFLQSKIAGYEARALGFDLGINYRVNPGLYFGGKIQNLGTEINFIEQSDPLPLVYGAGVAYCHNYNKYLNFQGNMDVLNYRDKDPELRLGGEMLVLQNFAFRGGYRTSEDLGDGLSLGLGFRFENLKLDYAYRDSGDSFDNRQNFSITYSF